jgi:hypothetical protein
MPDSLDIAQQRNLIERLKEAGQSTAEAEIRLRTMLQTLSAIYGNPWRAGEPQPERGDRGRG